MKFLMHLVAILISLNGSAQYVAPPGTIKLRENRFIDKRLITFANYDEFLHYLKMHDAARYALMLPIDTMVTLHGTQLWNNPKYENYPVVGVSKDQMIAYCQWRSEVVNIMAFARDRRTCNFSYWAQFDKMPQHQNLKITYTLPYHSDIRDAPVKREKYWLNEMTTDGSFILKHSTKINNPDLLGFRCIATYEVIQ